VSRQEQTPAQAFAVTSEAVGEVRRVIREHGVPDGSVQRSQLTLASAWGNIGNERKFLGYQCQASFVVESRELDGVQQLLVDVVAAGANEILGASFDVIDKPALRAEARRETVAAARRKAQLYAEAAGVRLGTVCTSTTWTQTRSVRARTVATLGPQRSLRARSRPRSHRRVRRGDPGLRDSARLAVLPRL
jgi:uncharacterized protein YggE